MKSLILNKRSCNPLSLCVHTLAFLNALLCVSVCMSICMTLRVYCAGVLYFILTYYTDRYNIYYVYKCAPFNGRQFLHRSAINFVLFGALNLQLAMLFFSVIRLGRNCVVVYKQFRVRVWSLITIVG